MEKKLMEQLIDNASRHFRQFTSLTHLAEQERGRNSCAHRARVKRMREKGGEKVRLKWGKKRNEPVHRVCSQRNGKIMRLYRLYYSNT